MVKRTRTDIARDFERSLPDQPSPRQSTRSNSHVPDEVIVSLADAYENKRARQVVEWERAQPIYLRQAV